MPNVIVVCVITLSIIFLSVILLSVILVNVVALFASFLIICIWKIEETKRAAKTGVSLIKLFSFIINALVQ
jgi:hypothetical protein